MTELGVYILGATALAILAAAGIATGSHATLICAAIASGAAYLSQLAAALPESKMAYHANGAFMLAAFVGWASGIAFLF